MATAEMRPMSFTECLDRTFTLYRRHFILFVGIMAVPNLVILAFNLVPELLQSGVRLGAGDASAIGVIAIGTVVSMLFLLLGYLLAMALGQAATVFAVSEISLGRSTTVGAAFARVRSRMWRLVDVMISQGLRVMIGFVLFVIPGILLMLRYSVAVPAAVLEDLKASAALKRSTSLTEGRRGEAFLILLLSFLLSWIASILFLLPVGILVTMYARSGEAIPFWLNLTNHALTFVASVLVGPIGMIAMSLFYYDCRVRKEAFDLQVMLSALDGRPAPTPSEAVVQS